MDPSDWFIDFSSQVSCGPSIAAGVRNVGVKEGNKVAEHFGIIYVG